MNLKTADTLDMRLAIMHLKHAAYTNSDIPTRLALRRAIADLEDEFGEWPEWRPA